MLLEKQLDRFDKALLTAHHFGFIPIAAPKITPRDIEVARACGDHPHYDAVDKAALLRVYLEENSSSLPQPLALAYRKPASRKKFGDYALHFIGATSAIAEATLIRTALSILSEEGHKQLRVDINCIGDKESLGLYEKGLINYIRKLGPDVSDEVKKNIKEDIFNLFNLDMPEALELLDSAPSSITFLSTQSRLHFKEVLEYIEGLGVEFRLAPRLIGERNHASHTIFAIREGESGNVLATGYRYSRLGRFFGLRKEIPMASVAIFPAKKGPLEKEYKNLPKPKFFLVQIGHEAKIRAISLIETLRAHRIPVYHFIGKDKITAQLSAAETLKVSHLIIIGQKEALEQTATVRNVATRAQDTVSIVALPDFLKNLPI